MGNSRFQSYKMGMDAERNFQVVCLEHGWQCVESTREENRVGKWDFLLSKEGKSFKVDVKASKKTSRSDVDPTDGIVWVEFKGITGHPGWLYGQADYIALNKPDGFLMILRTDLVDLSESLVDLTSTVTSSKDALYKSYTRAGRKDVISILKTSDLEDKSVILSDFLLTQADVSGNI